MDNKNDDKEVDLKDYLKLIFAKKWLVLSVFLTAVAAAVIYNFSVPKIYEAGIWLELGKIEENTPIENPAQISQKIKIGAYDGFSYDVVVLNPAQTNLTQLKIKSSNPDQVKKDLEKISALILAEHEEKISNKKEILEKEIEKLQAKVNFLEKERKILETKIETYIFEFDLFAAEEILLEAIVGSSAKLDSLKNSLGNIKSTKVIKPVTITYQSARPKLLLNIVLAGLIGLFSGIFIVFGKRWWKSEI